MLLCGVHMCGEDRDSRGKCASRLGLANAVQDAYAQRISGIISGKVTVLYGDTVMCTVQEYFGKRFADWQEP